jgi:hypothetical protein
MLIVLVYVTGDVAICSSRYYFLNRRLLRRGKFRYYSKSVNAPRNDVLNRRGKLSNCSEFVNAPRNDIPGGTLISKTDVLLVRTSLRGTLLNVYCFSTMPLATRQSHLQN